MLYTCLGLHPGPKCTIFTTFFLKTRATPVSSIKPLVGYSNIVNESNLVKNKIFKLHESVISRVFSVQFHTGVVLVKIQNMAHYTANMIVTKHNDFYRSYLFSGREKKKWGWTPWPPVILFPQCSCTAQHGGGAAHSHNLPCTLTSSHSCFPVLIVALSSSSHVLCLHEQWRAWIKWLGHLRSASCSLPPLSA